MQFLKGSISSMASGLLKDVLGYYSLVGQSCTSASVSATRHQEGLRGIQILILDLFELPLLPRSWLLSEGCR